MPYFCGCYWLVSRGLHWQPIRHYLPQVNVKAHTTIFASASRTTLTQTFVNPSSNKGIKEIRYTFPLYDGVSVVGFVCRVADRVITGEVQEKEKARTTYQEAVSRGETAGLLEQLPAASDVFTTTVGNVPPGATIYVEVTYVGELKHDAEVDGVRFTIPTNIAPRYGSLPGEIRKPDSAVPLKGGFEVVVDAELPDGAFIREMRSPSHPVAVSLGTTSVAPDADPVMNRASGKLSLDSAELDQDFVLQVVAKQTETPKAVLETHPTIPGQRALMATLVPKFALKPERPEIVFVCDRSGSMSGSKVKKLVEALKVFLKSLPTGVKFNICSFGSHYSFLWDKSNTYSQSSLDEAVTHVETFSANFGGTEMLDPIKETFKRRYKDMSLEVFLVTDGEIWNQEELFQFINEQIQVKKDPVRIFTLGIGNDVSHALIEGAARAGNGFSQAVNNNEKLDSKVVRMLKAGLSPHINDYTLEVKYHNAEDDFEIVEKVADSLKVNLNLSEAPQQSTAAAQAPISLFDTSANLDAPVQDSKADGKFSHVPTVPVPKMLQAPHQIPPLYAFSRTAIYLIMSPDCTQKTPASVVLRATSPQGPLELEIPVSILPQAGTTIHQLAARKAVQELEEGRGWLVSATENGKKLKDKYEGRFSDMVEREAVRLGVTFQVQGKWTSFVAVEKKEKDKEGDEKMADEEYEFLDDEVPPSYEQEDRPKIRARQGRGGSRGASNTAVPSTLFRKAPPSSPSRHTTAQARIAGAAPGQAYYATPALSASQAPSPGNHAMVPEYYMAGPLASSTVHKMRAGKAKKSVSPFSGIGSAIGGLFGSSSAAQTRSQSISFGSSAPSASRASASPVFGSVGAPLGGQDLAMGGPAESTSLANFDPTIEDSFVGAAAAMPLADEDLDDNDSDGEPGSTPPHSGVKKPWRYNPEASRVMPLTTGLLSSKTEKSPPDRMKETASVGISETKVKLTGDKLRDIIALQKFEGFWEWSKELCQIVGAKDDRKRDSVFTTAMAVRFLEVKLKGESDVWDLVVEKARGWLVEQCGGDEAKVENLCAQADKVIGA